MFLQQASYTPSFGGLGANLGSNAVLKIELDGSEAGGPGGVIGLDVVGGNSTVRGLAINRFRESIVLRTKGGNIVEGNFIGTDPTGTIARGNGAVGVDIGAPGGNTIGGLTPAARNLISANGVLGAGSGIGMFRTTANQVVGNFIGTDVTGTSPLGNVGSGIVIGIGASANSICGTSVSGRNIISGNTRNGVRIDGNGATVVQGNFIGTDLTGTIGLGNGGDGVLITTDGNTIGGTTAGARNIISDNGSDGVSIINNATGNLVQGNFIGTDVTGTAPLGNANVGVLIEAATNNTIGGATAGARNVISGNAFDGVFLATMATGNLVQGNFIGTDVTGTAAIGNRYGVYIGSSCGGGNIVSNNTIGGTSAGAGNVISGNRIAGVNISGLATGNLVQGNFIGTQVDGTSPLGNSGQGVHIVCPDATENIIGGTGSGAPNVIAHNGENGVQFIFSPTDNGVLTNSIFSNDGLGIDLVGVPSGVTPNDAGDVDTGPNNQQNFPVLTSAITDGSLTRIHRRTPMDGVRAAEGGG